MALVVHIPVLAFMDSLCRVHEGDIRFDMVSGFAAAVFTGLSPCHGYYPVRTILQSQVYFFWKQRVKPFHLQVQQLDPRPSSGAKFARGW